MSEQIMVPRDLTMAVTVHDGQAVLHLSQPREYVAMMPAEALQIGARMFTAAVEASPDVGQAAIAACMAVIDAVYEIKGDLKPAGGAVKHELIERHRATLTKRLEVVLNSQREKRTVSNAAMARGLVDIALSEVFS
jgi:hypothetical protein